MKNQVGIQGAWRLLKIQLGISLVCALAAGLGISWLGAWSALCGGLISAIPNAYFAHKLFQRHGARAARQIVNAFYLGEAVKIALAVLLFALVFAWGKLIPWVFFATYIGVQMTLWFAPFIFKRSTNRPESD